VDTGVVALGFMILKPPNILHLRPYLFGSNYVANIIAESNVIVKMTP